MKAIEKFKRWLKAANWQDEAIEAWKIGSDSAISGLWTIWHAGYLANTESHLSMVGDDRLAANDAAVSQP